MMFKGYVIKFLSLLCCALIVTVSFNDIALAHNRVVVVPLFDSAESIANVITVAKKGGDFTDPVTAMASISNANATNPYLIQIAPGVYQIDEPIMMKSHVRMVGSGVDTVVITRTHTTEPFDFNSGFLIEYPAGVTDSKLSNLSLDVQESNQSTNNVSFLALMHANSSAIWDNVETEINFTPGIRVIGLNSSSLKLRNSRVASVQAFDGGIRAESSRLEISNSQVISSESTISMLGDSSSRLDVSNSVISSSRTNPAVFLAGGRLTVQESRIFGATSSSSFPTINVDSGFTHTIENSRIFGSLDFGSDIVRANISNVNLLDGQITAANRSRMFCNNVANYSSRELLNQDCSDLE